MIQGVAAGLMKLSVTRTAGSGRPPLTREGVDRMLHIDLREELPALLTANLRRHVGDRRRRHEH